MKILFIETLGDGGIAHYTYNLIKSLRKRDVNTTLITTDTYEIRDTEIKTYGLFYKLAFSIISNFPIISKETVFPTVIRRVLKLLEFPFNMIQTMMIAKKERFDIIHFQTIHLIELLLVALFKFYGFRVVYTIHNVMPGHKKLSSIQKKLYAALYHFCDFFIIHSEISKNEVIALYSINPKKVYVIPHGDYRFFVPHVFVSKKVAKKRLGIISERKVILFFGAIRSNKGLHDLIAAIPIVKKAVQNIMLMIVGEAVHNYKRYKDQIGELRIQNCIYEELKYISNDRVSDYFFATDLVVLPYHEISQSGVLQVAYAFGKPVIATRVGGFQEIIDEGKNGYLVPPQKPSVLAEKIIELLTDNGKIEQMGKHSLMLSKKYSWKSIADQTETLYLKLSKMGAR